MNNMIMLKLGMNHLQKLSDDAYATQKLKVGLISSPCFNAITGKEEEVSLEYADPEEFNETYSSCEELIILLLEKGKSKEEISNIEMDIAKIVHPIIALKFKNKEYAEKLRSSFLVV